jgi:uroporphyrinogen III methyltransferase / synthase
MTAQTARIPDQLTKMTEGSHATVLAGKRILVTRPRAQADSLCERLATLGAQPILFPTIEIAPPEDYGPLDQALASLAEYDWVILTSVNGVAAFWSRLQAVGAALPPSVRLAAIGPATAQALEEQGVRAEFVPDEYIAESIVAGLGDVQGQRVLLPRADIARRALGDDLAARGAIVTEVVAYRTLPAAPDPAGLAELRRGVDVIIFTSSSTVRNFVALVGSASHSLTAVVACIGPITAATAHDAGLPVNVVAQEYTTEGVVAALAEYFSRSKPLGKEN